MGDWKGRLKRIDEANKKQEKEGFRDKRSKCDRCGKKMGRASRYKTPAGSIICYVCNQKKK